MLNYDSGLDLCGPVCWWLFSAVSWAESAAALKLTNTPNFQKQQCDLVMTHLTLEEPDSFIKNVSIQTYEIYGAV